MWKNSDLALSEKVEHADHSVWMGVVVKEIPLSTLVQFRPNPPDTLQEPFQNSLVNFRVYSLTLGYTFIMEQAFSVQKGDQHRLNLRFCQPTFFFFLGDGEDNEHHVIDCRLVSGSYW